MAVQEDANWRHDFLRQNSKRIQDVYSTGKKLGEGSFGSVQLDLRLATLHVIVWALVKLLASRMFWSSEPNSSMLECLYCTNSSMSLSPASSKAHGHGHSNLVLRQTRTRTRAHTSARLEKLVVGLGIESAKPRRHWTGGPLNPAAVVMDCVA